MQSFCNYLFQVSDHVSCCCARLLPRNVVSQARLEKVAVLWRVQAVNEDHSQEPSQMGGGGSRGAVPPLL